jgi:hypothetical protein
LRDKTERQVDHIALMDVGPHHRLERHLVEPVPVRLADKVIEVYFGKAAVRLDSPIVDLDGIADRRNVDEVMRPECRGS